jgi:hypothetical protein
MSSTTFWKLRRLAPRALRVVARRSPESRAVAAYAATVGPKAQAFVAAYDEAGRYRVSWQKEMGEGRGAVRGLVGALRRWLPLVARDVPGFVATEFADKPQVPDDVMEDAGRLHDQVHDYRDPAGNPLSYQADCLAELDAALAAAHQEWAEAEEADKRYQTLCAAMRRTAADFDLELHAFRRTLSACAGRSDKDFQKLRAEKASLPDPEDDPAAPQPPTPVPPAAPGEKPTPSPVTPA